MDVNVVQFNEKLRPPKYTHHLIPYQSHFRHGFQPHAGQSWYKPLYFHQGNRWNNIVGMEHFNQAPFIFNNQNFAKHRFENENDPTKVDRDGEHAVLNTVNAKEKSPMCLVNEISRFNKIEQKYTLTNEEGPAHKKVFFVSLKLGTETFSSSGQSIKKAKHAAALEALENTNYPKPPNKCLQVLPAVQDELNSSITPTVQLNTLAMKKGESVTYEVVGGFKSKKESLTGDAFNCFRGHNPAFVVKVSIGSKYFFGGGYSVKSARHSAALKALHALTNESHPSLDDKINNAEVMVTSSTAVENRGANCRSEVSRVHEIAFKRNFTTTFQVTGESGPAHMRTYTTTCTCGHLNAKGEGNSKKTSKRKSAEKMLEELSKLSPLPSTSLNKTPNKFKTKTENAKTNNKLFYKILKASPDYGAGINPVSRLIQIQQAKKQPEPSFSLLEERGKSRDREFHVQATVADKSCSSWATSKKLAKRNAAEKMLQLLGYSNNMSNNNNNINNNNQMTKPSEKEITTTELKEGLTHNKDENSPQEAVIISQL